MKRKILSVLLAISVLLPSIGVYAAFENEKAAGTILLESLGIFNGTEAERAEEYVKRSDAIYYALKVSGYSEIPVAENYYFSDVTSDTNNADAIEFGLSKGIIAEADTFSPDRNVSLSEFVKMTVSGLGNSILADYMGDYPNGYMEIAQQTRMLDKITVSHTGEFTYATLEKMLVNVLASHTIDMIGLKEYKLDTHENVMYKVFDIYTVAGMLTANAVTSLSSPNGLGENRVRIGNTEFEVNEDIYFELSGKLGCNLNLWVQERADGLLDKIICFEVKSGTKIEVIESEDFQSFTGGILTYVKNNRIKRVNIPASAAVIKNGKAYTDEIPSDFFNGCWGDVKLVRPSGNEVETVIFTVYENYYVGAINAKEHIISDNTTNNRNISLEYEGELSKYAYFRDVLGNMITFDNISVGAVVSIAANADYFDVIVVEEAVQGVLEKIDTDDDGNTVLFVNNNHYSLAPEMNASRAQSLKQKSEYTFYLDPAGRISAAVRTSSINEELNWAYLIDIDEPENDDRLRFKLLTSDGEKPKIYAAEKVRIDEKTYKDKNEIKGKFLSGGNVKSQVVRLSVNAEGEINKIDTQTYNGQNESLTDSVNMICDFDNSITRYWNKSSMTFNAACAANSNTVVFIIPKNMETAATKADAEEYIATTVNVWSQDDSAHIRAYNIDKYSTMSDVIVWEIDDTDTDSIIADDTLVVVSDIVTTLNEDDEVITVIEGYQDNSEKSWEIANDDVLKISATDSCSNSTGTLRVSEGDAVRLHISKKDNVVESIVLLYDCDTKQHGVKTGSGGNEIYELIPHNRFKSGLVVPFRIFDGYIMAATDLTKAPDEDGQVYVTYKLSSFKVYEVDATGKKPKVSQINASDIKDWYNYGTSRDEKVVMQARYEEGRTLVIYKY